jgi:hypothetical protein
MLHPVTTPWKAGTAAVIKQNYRSTSSMLDHLRPLNITSVKTNDTELPYYYSCYAVLSLPQTRAGRLMTRQFVCHPMLRHTFLSRLCPTAQRASAANPCHTKWRMSFTIACKKKPPSRILNQLCNVIGCEPWAAAAPFHRKLRPKQHDRTYPELAEKY